MRPVLDGDRSVLGEDPCFQRVCGGPRSNCYNEVAGKLAARGATAPCARVSTAGERVHIAQNKDSGDSDGDPHPGPLEERF